MARPFDGTSYRRSVAVNIASTDHDFSAGSGTGPCDAIYIGVTGNLVCRMAGDSADITFSNLPVGTHRLQIAVVRKTSTTTTNMVALYSS
jgi:hypothetical protein